MHGLIFTSFRQFTWTHFPTEADRIWAGLPRYLAAHSYPDEEFGRLLGNALRETGAERRDLLLRFGSYTAQTFFLLLRPEYYEESDGTQSFLLGIEERIHDVVRHTIPGAAPPRLQVVPLGEHGVSVTYTSERRLCDLLEGLLRGTAAHYRERFDIEQTTCMERGDQGCCFFMMPAASR